jgi:hypothetical protein
MKIDLKNVINIARTWDGFSSEHFDYVYNLIVNQLDITRKKCGEYNKHKEELLRYEKLKYSYTDYCYKLEYLQDGKVASLFGPGFGTPDYLADVGLLPREIVDRICGNRSAYLLQEEKVAIIKQILEAIKTELDAIPESIRDLEISRARE